jgi:hypothetical protein
MSDTLAKVTVVKRLVVEPVAEEQEEHQVEEEEPLELDLEPKHFEYGWEWKP